MENILDTELAQGGQRLGVGAMLRGTDAGTCSTCHQPSNSLVNGKCPRHVVLFVSDESAVPNLLTGGQHTSGGRQRSGTCRPGQR